MNNPLSYSSVKLEFFSKEGVPLQQESGFVVETANQHYLITNRHLVSTRDIPLHGQKEPTTEPHILKTAIHIFGGDREFKFPLSWGVWKKITIALYENDGTPRWIECHTNEQNQPVPDVVALPIQLNHALKFNQTLSQFSGKVAGSNISMRPWAKISAFSISAIDANVEYGPPDAVHVVGYPIGWAPAGKDRSSAAFWRRSSIASEMEELGKLQANTFYIDPTAPEGMSGSPVVGMKNDRLKLLGVYSDHSTAGFGANAGMVWNAFLVKELVGM